MIHINMTSGGLGSYITGKRLEQQYPGGVEYLFTDTLWEDGDLYRFLIESVGGLTGVNAEELVRQAKGIPDDTNGTVESQEKRKQYIIDLRLRSVEVVPHLKWVAEGRTIWEVMKDKRFISNNRVDHCSQILKRQLARKWVKDRYSPKECRLYVGIDFGESHRFTLGIQKAWLPYIVEAPLISDATYTKKDMLIEVQRDGIDPPILYDEGFPHNNCRGVCVKAGHAQWQHLLKHRPEVYRLAEQKEEECRQVIGQNVSILRDRKGGDSKPLTLRRFRLEVVSGERIVNPRDFGSSCQCFSPEELVQ